MMSATRVESSEPHPASASTVRVLAFAAAAELIEAKESELRLEGVLPVSEAWSALLARWPRLKPYRSAIRVAVNGTYAEENTLVRPGDELALIPPVAGG
jgi:molybdopterin converting factor subunit 1